jgi:hypothetical protein
MALSILNSQSNPMALRFTNGGGPKLGMLAPFKWSSLLNPISSQWYYANPSNAAAWGTIATWLLPVSQGSLGNLFIETNITGVTGTSGYGLAPYVGIQAIDRVMLSSSSGTCQDYRNAPVTSMILSTLTSSPKTTILNGTGGAVPGTAGGFYCSPLYLFWTSISLGQIEYGGIVPPLATFMIDRLQLDVYYNPMTSVIIPTATTGATLNNARLWYQIISTSGDATDKLRGTMATYKYKSVDWQTNENALTYTANASANVDFNSINGSINKVQLQNKTNLAANDPLTMTPFNSVRLLVDGVEINNTFNTNSMSYIQLFTNSVYTDTTLSDGYTMNFGASGFASNATTAYKGSLDTSLITSLQCQNVQSISSGTIQWCAALDVIYKIENRSLVRYR